MSQRLVRRAGVTLIELLIVLVIVGILASIAWPSFVSAMNKGRRADAFSALARLTQAQERWRANQPFYKQDLEGWTEVVETSAGGHYQLSLVAVSDAAKASRYRARATAINTSPQANDSPCQVLEVEMNAGAINYRSYGSADGDANSPESCWVR